MNFCARRAKIICAVILFVVFTGPRPAHALVSDALTPDEAERVGAVVFKNECASRDQNLIVWNGGEDFLSAGIGHFIWLTSDSPRIFEESFSGFIEFAKGAGCELPVWLDSESPPPCPWNSRDEFMAVRDGPLFAELKEFLVKTKTLQARFIIKRLDEALPRLLESVPGKERDEIESRFNRVAQTARGVYALADYVNFKGLGILPSERYQGKGWGLLQVLQGMRSEADAPDAVVDFVRSAGEVLVERVNGSSPERNEKRWLAGWLNRVGSYAR